MQLVIIINTTWHIFKQHKYDLTTGGASGIL
jgi:hypothetical protein